MTIEQNDEYVLFYAIATYNCKVSVYTYLK